MISGSPVVLARRSGDCCCAQFEPTGGQRWVGAVVEQSAVAAASSQRVDVPAPIQQPYALTFSPYCGSEIVRLQGPVSTKSLPSSGTSTISHCVRQQRRSRQPGSTAGADASADRPDTHVAFVVDHRRVRDARQRPRRTRVLVAYEPHLGPRVAARPYRAARRAASHKQKDRKASTATNKGGDGQ